MNGPLNLIKDLPLLAHPWKTGPEYQQYVLAQVSKSQRAQHYIAGERVTRLVGLLVRHDRRSPLGRSALAIGCRNLHEIHVLEAAGFEPVMGIDLFSSHPRILPMDMHALQCGDGAVDVVFACHSLEHAYDPHVVISEYRRVLKPGGTLALETPINFPHCETDRADAGTLETLLAWLAPLSGPVLYSVLDQGVGRVVMQRT